MEESQRQDLERQLDGLEAAIKAYSPLGRLLATLWKIEESEDPRHDLEQALNAIYEFLTPIPHPKGSDLPLRRLAELMLALNDLDGPGKVGDILKRHGGAHGKGFASVETLAHDLRARTVQALMQGGENGREQAARKASNLQKKRDLTARNIESQYQHQTRNGREPQVRKLTTGETKAAMDLAGKLEKPSKPKK